LSPRPCRFIEPLWKESWTFSGPFLLGSRVQSRGNLLLRIPFGTQEVKSPPSGNKGDKGGWFEKPGMDRTVGLVARYAPKFHERLQARGEEPDLQKNAAHKRVTLTRLLMGARGAGRGTRGGGEKGQKWPSKRLRRST